MRRLADSFALPVLRRLEAETAHRVALRALRHVPLPPAPPDDPRLHVAALGLSFPNPLGIAAGFDKNGEVIDAVLRLGCGFAEVGTVTPRPQAGNPRPRIFRLSADHGVINRLGFNNEGHAAVRRRLGARSRQGILGVNVGANKDSADRVADYVSGIQAFADIADYFTVNVSSPNTPGLRDLQQAGVLDDLLARVLAVRDESAATFRRKPVLLKIAPDLALGDLDDIVAVARRRRIDGMIVSNTTVRRPAQIKDQHRASEAGGLSGRPLFALSTRILAEAFLRAEGTFPLVGAGGIDSGSAALAKIRAGATLIQLYSGLVYDGLGLIPRIKAHLARELDRTGEAGLAALVGGDAAEWARGAALPADVGG